MLVREMAPRDRPIARLRDLGPQALTTVELVTVVLGMQDLGTAHSILAKVQGSLRTLSHRGTSSVLQERGVGFGKAAQLAAALELGRRLAAETRDDAVPLRSPRDVVAIMAPKLEDLPVEEFHVLILNAQHRLERDVVVTRGILNSSLVHPREVFREAIAERAAAIILVHNHPSGNPAPSADDRAVTDQLVSAGRILDIGVHDHVIIGRGQYTSFAEAGLL